MRYRLGVIVVFTGLLVTGCSSTNGETYEPKYDEVELAVYQACLNNALAKLDPDLGDTARFMGVAVGLCKDLLPTKK
jgi:outer membrane murein-binding lipoprotein Lpp